MHGKGASIYSKGVACSLTLRSTGRDETAEAIGMKKE
jgi:hypothetical protein